ncbi:MAG: hypothetical protein QOD86_3035 [Miltoncostaeaceae bacterium]|jgi:hypothetical protein|nr:hypothetical protein [Miltoncostaeaceae bacterium]
MTKIRNRALGAALAAGALVALPAAASAHPGHGSGNAADAVAKVTAHTERADAALDRAADLFADGRERPAAGAVHRSQAALRHAVKTTARIVRKADTDEERGVAATAVITVATEMDEEIPTLVGLLDTAQSARADLRLAKAALADARGREKAIEILNDLMEAGLPAESQAAVTAAITALSTDRSAEIAKATAALEDPDTSEATGKTIRLTIDVTLDGQERAADILRQLIAQLPDAAKGGLQRALDAVSAEREDSAEGLDEASDRMPDGVRKFIDRLAHHHMAPPADDDATAPEGATT